MMVMSPYREVEHTADWALHVWAPTIEMLFVDAARGMYALVGAAPAAVAPGTPKRFELEAGDYESLLVAWLQELLYHTDSQGCPFDDFRVLSLTPTRLQAEASPVAGDDRLDQAIKAVTYHNLNIQHTPNGFEVTIVFDV